MKKGIILVVLACILVVSVVIAGCAPASKPAPAPAPAPTPPPASTPVELKMWSAWPKDMPMNTAPFVDWFIDRVNEQGKAVKLSVKYLGGPEVFPANEGTPAISKGLADIGYTTTVYHTGIVPEGEAMKLSRILPWEERESGAFQLMDEFHRKKSNTTFMYRLAINNFFHLWLNVNREKPDLSGLKIRSTPAYDSFVKALGGTTLSIAGPEAYTAVERNLVDGYGFPPQEVQYRKMEVITKYVWGPPFYASPTGQFMNLDKWNSLSNEQRALLTAISKQIERDSAKEWDKFYQDTMKYLTGQGKMQWIKFSPADEKYFLDTAYNAGWETLIKTAPDAAKLRPLMKG